MKRRLIAGLNLKLAEVDTISLAKQPLSHPKEANTSKAFIVFQPDSAGPDRGNWPRLWGRGGGSALSGWSIKKMSVREETREL